jgi:hypothetical protein
MARFSMISAGNLMRLIDTPHALRLIDVTTAEDFEDDPFLIPTARRMPRALRGINTIDHALAPEAAGLPALSVGLSRAYPDDLAQMEAGLILYDALYRWARDGQGETHDWQEVA